MAYEFKFPDVGEGITEGELLSWKVAEGEEVREDQTLAEVETDKAVVEVPSPRAGRIQKLHAEEGDMIEVGQVLVTIEEAAAKPGAEQKEKESEVPAGGSQESKAPEPGEVKSSAHPKPPATQIEEAEEFYTGSVVGRLEEAPEEDEEPGEQKDQRPQEEEETTAVKVEALPSVRALARELAVDLSQVHGTGPGGRILRRDVEDYAEAATYGRQSVGAPSVAAGDVADAEPWMDGSLEEDDHGVVERIKFRGVRRTMARRMAEARDKQALVTTTEEADVSVVKRIREKERTLASERGIKLTYLAFVVKACAVALRRFPRLNAVLEESCEEVLLKRYYNIGLAIDTKAGLVVPNIKEADGKSIFLIAEEIVDLVDRAQERKLGLDELHGGTFTITNYGAIGGIHATPIPNYPEVSILGMGRVRAVPVALRGKVAVRQMLPLSLTYDHQLVDGAEAARFLNLVVNYLEDPDILLLEGA